MNEQARSIVGLPGSGLTTQCVEWLTELLAQGIDPQRIIVLVRHSAKAKEFRERLHGRVWGEVQIRGYTSFVQVQLSSHWAEVCLRVPGLPPGLQPLFLGKDLTQFLLSHAFDSCADHFQRFRFCTLPDYEILDQIVSDGYVAHSAGISCQEVGKRLAAAWIDQKHSSHLLMLKSIPCCLQNLGKVARQHQGIYFGLHWELFSRVLLTIDRFWQTWDYLIVDDGEESSEVFLNFYKQALEKGKKLFLAYRMGGGSSFTNADRAVATFVVTNTNYFYSNSYPGMGELGMAIAKELGAKLKFPVKPQTRKDYTDRVKLLTAPTYLKAIEATISTLEGLLTSHPPDRMAILMPKFDQVLMQIIQHSSIGSRCSFLNPYVSFLRYPIIRAMLTMALLIQREQISPPSLGQISATIGLFVGTDPIRSMLLAQTFDRQNFQQVPSSRIDRATLDSFSHFTDRLNFYQQNPLRLDLFWGHIIREFSPNFKLTPTDREVLHSLMATAGRFFVAFPDFDNFQFIQMLLSGQTPTVLQQWDYDRQIIVATPLQFLKTDRVTDYQFWFNITGREWRKPVCRELLNHEVLHESWDGGVYTSDHEQELRTDQLARNLLNLSCRNQQTIYLVKAQTNIQGEDNYIDLDHKILTAALPTQNKPL